MGRIATSGGDYIVSHHQHAKVIAGQLALDHHAVAVLSGGGIRGEQLLAGLDIDGYAFALIAVFSVSPLPGSQSRRRLPRHPLRWKLNDPLARHTGGVEQPLRKVLVLGDGLGDCTGAVSFRGLDAALLAAPAELHQATVGEPAKGDPTLHGCLDNGGSTRPEANVFIEIPEPG